MPCSRLKRVHWKNSVIIRANVLLCASHNVVSTSAFLCPLQKFGDSTTFRAKFITKTRKSSRVSAKGVPPAAYLVYGASYPGVGVGIPQSGPWYPPPPSSPERGCPPSPSPSWSWLCVCVGEGERERERERKEGYPGPDWSSISFPPLHPPRTWRAYPLPIRTWSRIFDRTSDRQN